VERGGVERVARQHAPRDLERRPLGHDAPEVEEHDAVAHLLHLLHVVGRVQEREAALAPDREQLLERLVRDVGIEARGGLVEDEELGVVEQRPGEARPRLLAQGEVAEALDRLLAELEALEPALHGEPRRAGEQRVHAQVLAHREPPVHHRLGGGEAHPRQRRPLVALGIHAEHVHRARVRTDQAQDHVERRGPGAVGAEEPQDLPAAQLERHVAEGVRAAKALGEAVHRDGRRGVESDGLHRDARVERARLAVGAIPVHRLHETSGVPSE
jgi:hypothetical protein